MDPASTLLLVFKIINEISLLSEDANFNKLRCKDLKLRCQSVEGYLKRIDRKHVSHESLKGLIETLKDCKKFMIKMNTSGLITRFFSARSINREYDFLKSNLGYWKTETKENYIDLQKEDNDFNREISMMNNRLERAKRLLNARNVENKILNQTIIDKSLVQKGDEKNYPFAFGMIYDGLYKKKQKIVIKEINSFVDDDTLNMIKKGILLNWNLKDCDYVLKVYGLTKLSNNWMIITESTVFDVLNNLFKYQIENKDKISIARKIAAGIAYIHECDVIHKDIRSHNIMIDAKFEPKIGGFEMSREVSTATYAFTNADAFVRKWWAPERLAGRISSKASDVYSFGVLMYEISTFALPDDSAGIMVDNISENYSKLISNCLAEDPSDRPTMNEVVMDLFNQETEF
jgi:serine/threonine protein kinase